MVSILITKLDSISILSQAVARQRPLATAQNILYVGVFKGFSTFMLIFFYLFHGIDIDYLA